MNSSLDTERPAAITESDDASEALMSYSALMWGSGSTAIRTREFMEMMARKMGFDAIAISLSLDGITACVRHSGKLVTLMRVGGTIINPEVQEAAREVVNKVIG